MGVAVTGQHSASHNKQDGQQASSTFSPVHRRAVTGNAPSTPSGVVLAKAPKRLQHMAEDDDNESLDGSSNENQLRQYDKWSVEEEQIFFLKLRAVTTLKLLECFKCIAQHLPNKDRDQVRNYYYKLKAQFQKHNPDRDLDDLTQKEMFQAMNRMWSAWSRGTGKGGSKPKLSQRKRLPSNPTKQARYIQTMQESLEQVFEVKERKAEVKAQREAERLAQQRAAKKAERLQQREAERVRQQEAEGLCQREAERQADEQGIRTSKPFKKACASGSLKENSSFASNSLAKRQPGQGRMQLASAHMIAKPVQCKTVPKQLDEMINVPAAMPTAQRRGPKGNKQAAAAAASDALTTQRPAHQDSDAQISDCQDSEAKGSDSEDSDPHDSGAHDSLEGLQLTQDGEELQITQQEQQPDFANTDAVISEQQAPELQQGHDSAPQASMSQQDAAVSQASDPQPAAPVLASAKTQQQRFAAGALQPGMFAVQSREPLCLRIRPLDSATKRLMQALGCTALLEMPNNKPKKAVEGLLRHLQKKWERVRSQLGGAYELCLVGMSQGQQEQCLCWRSEGISSALTLGQVQQQLQQTGAFLEVSYVWLPVRTGASPVAPAQDKASISALAAAGYAMATQGSAALDDGADREASHAIGANVEPRLPFGSPLGPESQQQRPAVAASSSSSARVLSEAFSNLQPEAAASLHAAAAVSIGQKSAAGENQTAALAVDVTSSVSGLVTPCKAQHGLLHESGPAKHDDTPGSSQLAPSSARQGLAWEGSSLLGHADFDIEPRLSQSHPDCMGNEVCPAKAYTDQATGTEPEARTEVEHPADQPASCAQASGPFLEAAEHFPGQFPDALSEQSSGFLSREASVWSVQPPGALSTEPSGCWDDMPDVPMSPEVMGNGELPDQATDLQQLPQQLNACVDLVGSQHYAEDACLGMFDMPEEMDFELPLLDSPDQAALFNACSADNQQLPATELPQVEPLQQADHAQASVPGTSGDDQTLCGAQQLNSQAIAGCHEALPADPKGSTACGLGSFSALLAAEEVTSAVQALPDEFPHQSCSQPYTQEPCLPEGDKPALGIPLLGTIVMGVPLEQATPPKRGRAGQAKQAKAQQREQATTPKAGQRNLDPCQSADEQDVLRQFGDALVGRPLGKQAGDGAEVPGQQAGDCPEAPRQQAGDALDAQQQQIGDVTPQQQKAKPKKRRKAKRDTPAGMPPTSPGAVSLQQGVKKKRKAKFESPPRLPPISPGALSLQEGVKRRRLARLAEAQAAAAAVPSCRLPAGQLESSASAATEADIDPPSTSQPAPDSSAVCLGQQHAPSHAIQCSQVERLHSGEACHEPGSTSAAGCASHREGSTHQPREQQTGTGQQPEQTLSFDVGAMELFQQQDTCDAFGSFWRRTSSIGAQKSLDGFQNAKAAPTTFGAGDISLGGWTETEQANKAAAKGPASRPAKEAQHSANALPNQEAQQAETPAGSGDMDLTTYFAMLPNEVVPFRDLISPLPVTASDPAEQQTLQCNPESRSGADLLLCNEDSLASGDSQEEAEAASPTGSGSSRPPTEQEIKHMDELDLSVNLGSLLGPRESWIVDDSGQFASLEGNADHAVCMAAQASGTALSSRPFQELFPVAL